MGPPSAFPADVAVVTLGMHVAERAPPALLSRIYDDVVAQLQRASAGVTTGHANSGGGGSGGRRDLEGETGKAAPRAHRRRRGPINIVAGYHAGLRAGGGGGGGGDGGGGDGGAAERAHAYLRHADHGAGDKSDSLGIKRLNTAAQGAV